MHFTMDDIFETDGYKYRIDDLFETYGYKYRNDDDSRNCNHKRKVLSEAKKKEDYRAD